MAGESISLLIDTTPRQAAPTWSLVHDTTQRQLHVVERCLTSFQSEHHNSSVLHQGYSTYPHGNRLVLSISITCTFRTTAKKASAHSPQHSPDRQLARSVFSEEGGESGAERGGGKDDDGTFQRASRDDFPNDFAVFTSTVLSLPEYSLFRRLFDVGKGCFGGHVDLLLRSLRLLSDALFLRRNDHGFHLKHKKKQQKMWHRWGHIEV